MLMLDISTSVGCETGLFHESSSHSPVPLGGCQRKRCGGACWVWGVELRAGLGQPGIGIGLGMLTLVSVSALCVADKSHVSHRPGRAGCWMWASSCMTQHEMCVGALAATARG